MFCNFAYFLHVLRTYLVNLFFTSMCINFIRVAKRVRRELLWIFLEKTVHSDRENEDFLVPVHFFQKIVLV